MDLMPVSNLHQCDLLNTIREKLNAIIKIIKARNC